MWAPILAKRWPGLVTNLSHSTISQQVMRASCAGVLLSRVTFEITLQWRAPSTSTRLKPSFTSPHQLMWESRLSIQKIL